MHYVSSPSSTLRVLILTTSCGALLVANGCAAGGGGSSGGGGGNSGIANAGNSGIANAGNSGIANAGNSGIANGGTGGLETHCVNGVMDGDETDTDCGGVLCPACNAEYRLNPPNACQNQFYYENCTTGDASTVCGGVCQPRNACENATSKDGAVGFACSRYMLFSSPMLAAAKDDAQAYGWPTPEDPPFNYAVAGHDTNTGGVDAGMTGTQPCCECYQLVFNAPYQEGDANNNQSPPPKPLVVQVFNIGATTQSFDLYMAAGGFGAFNGCANSGGLTASAGYSLYESYPTTGQWNNGGVKFRTYDECRTTTPDKSSTVASISSATCQDKIAADCNLLNAPASPALTSASRSSCIRGNQVESLYHQNWDVYVRRVECPTNLTRVTGCKLGAEPGLAKVDATITTAVQAQAAGFLSGYHTTTMQDCCKPACSWVEKVGGKEANKNADATWTNFYTCDANDQPMLAP
jgi:hypothetical protein